MPELPEVEVVRLGLTDHVVGRTITSVTVLDARSLRRHLPGPVDFADRLRGRTVVGARRRGKYLWLPLDDDSSLLCHLGMSGQMLISAPEAEVPRHLRVVLDLADGTQLRFVDQRIFGGMSLSESAELPAEIAHIARDPLDPLFDADEFSTRLRKRETGVKRALLDQTLISGVGNIQSHKQTPSCTAAYTRVRRPCLRGSSDA